MQFRGLMAAAGILALLAAGLWFSNKSEADKEKKPAAGASPKITEIPTDQINKIEIVKGPDTTSVSRGADNKWALTSPKALRADQETVNTLANTFNALASERLLETEATEFKPFGLDPPLFTVTVTKKDGKAVKLLIGDETPTQGGYFVRLDGDPRVFSMAGFNKSGLDKSFKDLQDKRLVTFDSDKLTRVELTAQGRTLEFGKNNNNEWAILKPQPWRADGGNVEELVRKIRDAKMDTTATDDDLKKFGTGWAGAAAVALAKVTDASGTQVLEVRKSKDNTYYVKGSAAEGVHKAATDLGDGLNKPLDDYRQKKVFDFGWNDPGKVDVNDAGKALNLSKSGDKWSAGGKEMDSTSVNGLIDKLRDLSAVKFADSGFTTSVFDATVVSSEGKRTEKVLISQAGDKYYAKRDNEPGVYEISKQAFDDLKKAASDVKEPPPPKKDEKKDEKKK